MDICEQPTQAEAKSWSAVCFTGFYGSRKTELQDIAKEKGFKCVTSVTKGLAFLCKGEDPGPPKIKEAKKQGVPIISEKEFLAKNAGGFLISTK